MTDDIPLMGDNNLPAEPVLPEILPETPAPQSANPTPPFSLLALFALIAGLTGPALACVGSALIAIQARKNDQMPLIVSLILVSGFIGLPLAWYARGRLQGRYSLPWQTRWLWAVVGAVALIVLIGLGQLLVSYNVFPGISLAIIQPLIFWAGALLLLAVVGSNHTGLSRLRAWGHFISGAWLAVVLAIVAEVIVIVIMGIVVVAILAAVAPDQARELIDVLRHAQNGFINDQAITGFLLRPWVIISAYLAVSVAIPIIEEFLKPIGVVLLIGRKPQPGAAFLGGLLGGLGFAVLESLSNLVNIQDPWAALVIARVGTLVMHGFTAGLVGWGWGQLASGKPLRLALAYLGAITIHGLWNGAVVTFVFAGLAMGNNPASVGFSALLVAGVLLILALVVGCVAGLIWLGYRFRTQALAVSSAS
jgi:hypothetical protein